MLIGFIGATGRTDASHAAFPAARAFAAAGVRTTFLFDWPPDVPAPAGDDALDVVRTPTGRIAAAKVRRAAREACRDGDRIAVAGIPAAWFARAKVRSSLDMAIVVVGPHEADERGASSFVGSQARPPHGTQRWYLGCRRAGGGPAATEFAAAMARIDPAAAVLAFAAPPLGRREASSLVRTAPAGHALRIGRSPVAAIGQAAAIPAPNRFMPLFADAPDEPRGSPPPRIPAPSRKGCATWRTTRRPPQRGSGPPAPTSPARRCPTAGTWMPSRRRSSGGGSRDTRTSPRTTACGRGRCS